jgi:G3E family GTPase
MDIIPFYLVTGFLGSGKTTFLKHIIGQNNGHLKIGIIQNEFAPANIDGVELRNLQKPFEILEINNGSVFCVCLLGDFVVSLKSFVEDEKPDLVILESSGLSDPIAISEILQSEELKGLVYLSTCWCIVDTLNYHRMLPILTRIKHQIAVADFIFLNKTDLVDSITLVSVKDSVQEINPLADVIESEYCRVEINAIFNKYETGNYRTENSSKNMRSAGLKGAGPPALNARVFKTGRTINLVNLRQLINRYIDQTIRIKGFVLLDDYNIVSVQTVFDKIDIRRIEDKTGNTALILMGEDFNLTEFSRDFRQLTE